MEVLMEEPIETRRRIEHEDPNLVHLRIGPDRGQYYSPHDGDWGRLGADISMSTNLRRLDILNDGVSDEEWNEFFRGLSYNKSIQDLRVDPLGCWFFSSEMLRGLTPFFRNNPSLESLTQRDFPPPCLHLLASALEKFGSLKEFVLYMNDDYDEEDFNSMVKNGSGKNLIKALARHSSLGNLLLEGCGGIGRRGHAELARLLKNKKYELAGLSLRHNTIMDDETASILAKGLAGNGTLRWIDLKFNPGISMKGWKTIYAALRSSCCNLEEIGINDSVSILPVRDLANIETIKALDLAYSDDYGVTLATWRALFECLQSSDCCWEEVCFTSCGFNDALMTPLANSLMDNTSLKNLCLRSNDDITAVGWKSLSAVLSNTVSELTVLDLSLNNIDDESMDSLAYGISGNGVLRELILGTGDGTACSLDAFSPVLCNESSIMGTYRSNHTLCRLCHECQENSLPPDLRSHLMINRTHGESRAAFLKIVNTHFNRGFAAPPFLGMEEKILPYAIAWMGRVGMGKEVYGHFFEYVKSAAWLFNITGGRKRRSQRLLNMEKSKRFCFPGATYCVGG